VGEELKSVALCLLDDLNISEAVKLDEFEIRFYQPAELQAMFLKAGPVSPALEASDRLKVYGEFPWARFERPIPADKVKTAFHRCLQQRGLSYAHAGVRSWWPFDDLLRTLHLLKPAGGPVIGKQFYYWHELLTEPTKHIDRVIYGEPLWDAGQDKTSTIQRLDTLN